MNVESLPDGPKNPYGVGFVANETVLRSEKEAQRMGDLNTSRVWKVKNPNSINPLNGEAADTGACQVVQAPRPCSAHRVASSQQRSVACREFIFFAQAMGQRHGAIMVVWEQEVLSAERAASETR